MTTATTTATTSRMAEFYAACEERERKRDRLRAEIPRRTAGATIASFINADRTRRIVIHRAVRADRSTPWQLTYIDNLGPRGHNNPPSFEEGLFRAAGCSAEHYWNESGFSLEWSDNLGTPPPF